MQGRTRSRARENTGLRTWQGQGIGGQCRARTISRTQSAWGRHPMQGQGKSDKKAGPAPRQSQGRAGPLQGEGKVRACRGRAMADHGQDKGRIRTWNIIGPRPAQGEAGKYQNHTIGQGKSQGRTR